MGAHNQYTQTPDPKKAPRAKLSRRKAIRELCLDCSAWSTKEVSQCAMTKCPLYPYRMGKGKQSPTARNKAIRAYCLFCCMNQPKEVRLCPYAGCPLFPFRMGGSSSQDASLSQKNDIYGGNSEDRAGDEDDSLMGDNYEVS
jgi:hypothetical protein